MVEPFVAIPFVPVDDVYADGNHVAVVHFEGIFDAHAEFGLGFHRNRNCQRRFAAVFVALYDGVKHFDFDDDEDHQMKQTDRDGDCK